MVSEKDLSKSPIVNIINSGRLLPAERNYFEKNYKAFAKTKPVYQRVTKEQITSLLTKKLKEDNININYEFAIYGNDLATQNKFIVYREFMEEINVEKLREMIDTHWKEFGRIIS